MNEQQIQKISCVICFTRLGNQKLKLKLASNSVARAYCVQPNTQNSHLTKVYNFRNVFG